MVVVKDLAGTESLKHGKEHRARRALDGHCEGPGGKQMADEAVSMDNEYGHVKVTKIGASDGNSVSHEGHVSRVQGAESSLAGCFEK